MKIPNFLNKQFTDKNGYLTNDWREALTQLFTQMQLYLSDEGVFAPQQPTTTITALNTSRSVGAILFNNTTNLFEGCVVNGTSGIFKPFSMIGGSASYSDLTLANLTPNTALVCDADKTVISSITTDTELGYVHGVTSSIQSQINGKEPTISAGLSTQYWRGDKTWQILDTSAVPENTNLYYTDARARAAISETVTGLDYSSTTGVLSLTSGYVIPTTTEETNWNNSHYKWIDIQRQGFVNNAQTSISFNDSTYVFTLTDLTGGIGWKYLYQGYEYTIIGDKTVTLPGSPPASGVYFIYINSTNGTLIQSTSEWSLLDSIVPVAIVRWNNSLTPKYWIADERHTCLIDKMTHYYEHYVSGTKFIGGGILVGPDVTPSSPTNLNNTYGIGVTNIADEDLLWTLLALTRPNGTATDYVCFYRTSATAWSWVADAMPYYYTVGGYINYDNAGTMTQGSNNNYYNSYLLLTNLNGAARYVVINGRGQFNTLVAAQAENPATFDFTGIGIQELVIAYQFTWRTSSAYTNNGKCRLESSPVRMYISLISTSISAPTTSHNSLAGLQGGLSPNEYYHLSNIQYVIATQASSATLDGYLLSTDWNLFNNKQDALTIGNITGSGNISVGGGTGSIIGAGVSLDTIQGITTSSLPEFANIGLGTPAVATNLFTGVITGNSPTGINLTVTKNNFSSTAYGINLTGSVPSGSGNTLTLAKLTGTVSTPNTLNGIDLTLSSGGTITGAKISVSTSSSGFQCKGIDVTYTSNAIAILGSAYNATLNVGTAYLSTYGCNMSMTSTLGPISTSIGYNTSITMNNSDVSAGANTGRGFTSTVSNIHATNRANLYGYYSILTPKLTADTAYGIFLSNGAAINDPTVDQMQIYIATNGTGTDANNKKWAFYNAVPNTTSGKIFLGKNDTPTYWGTTYDASQYYDGTNHVMKVTDGQGIMIGTTVLQKIGCFGAPPVVQQTGGAATAGAVYTSNEQNMLNAVYSALRAYGLLS